jgi:predicted secreted protein
VFFLNRVIIDRRQVEERSNRSYASRIDEATHLWHAARQAQDLAMQIGNLLADSF